MKILKDLATGLLKFARSPLGGALLQAGLVKLGGPIAPMVGRFGVDTLTALLPELPAEFSEEDVEKALAAKGLKVEPATVDEFAAVLAGGGTR